MIPAVAVPPWPQENRPVIAAAPVALLWLTVAQVAPPAQTAAPPGPAMKPVAVVREAFRRMLDRPLVPLDTKANAPHTEGGGLVSERLSFATEKKADGSTERVPALVVRPAADAGRRPAVIVLH